MIQSSDPAALPALLSVLSPTLRKRETDALADVRVTLYGWDLRRYGSDPTTDIVSPQNSRCAALHPTRAPLALSLPTPPAIGKRSATATL